MIQGFTDPIIANTLRNEIREMVLNERTFRQRLMETTFDRRRDYNKECGFPETSEIDCDRLYAFYERDAICARVVDIWPDECFQARYEVYETEDETQITPFEEAIRNLPKELGAETSYSNDDESDLLASYLHRADKECGVNRYSVIVIGSDDESDLSAPLEFKPGPTVTRKLTFLRVYPEKYAQISQREGNKFDKRYGRPTVYNIQLDASDNEGGMVAGSVNSSSGYIHWTRVVHIADNLMKGSEILGQPRPLPVFNNILSCFKVTAGSAEMYWQGAFPGLSFETHPQMGGDVSINKTKMRGEIEQFFNGMQRYLVNRGMSVKSLAPQVVDPTPQIDKQIEQICIKGGYPVPVFKGYEVGENAGSMNTEQWQERIRGRQRKQLTPRCINPLYDRFINLGMLPIPKQGYKTKWGDIAAQSRRDKAEVGNILMDTLVAYMSSPLPAILPPEDMLVKFVDMTPDESKALISKAQKTIAETQKIIETVRIDKPTNDNTDKPSSDSKSSSAD